MSSSNRKAEFIELLEQSTEWGCEQFPHATIQSIAEHLRRESIELAAAPDDPEEYAHVAMLINHLIHHVSKQCAVHNIDIISAVRAKLEKNKLRRWGEPDADGVVSHVE